VRSRKVHLMLYYVANKYGKSSFVIYSLYNTGHYVYKDGREKIGHPKFWTTISQKKQKFLKNTKIW